MTTMNNSMKDMFAVQIDAMRVTFENTMTATIKSEFSKIKDTFNADIDALTTRLTALEQKPAPTTYAGATTHAQSNTPGARVKL